MDWATVATLIVTKGFDVSYAIWQKWSKGTPPTQADWDELRALCMQTATDRAKARLTAAGIPLDDPRAIELLKLVEP